MGLFENNHFLNMEEFLEANSYPLLVRAERATFFRGKGEVGEIWHAMLTIDGFSGPHDAGRLKVHPRCKMGLNCTPVVGLASLVLPYHRVVPPSR